MTTAQRAFIGADIEDILDHHFKEIASAIPETFDLIERYTMRIARLEGGERDLVVDDFRQRLLDLIRTKFTVRLTHQQPLDQIA